MVSVDVKQYRSMLTHWSQLVSNMSTDIRGHHLKEDYITNKQGGQSAFSVSPLGRAAACARLVSVVYIPVGLVL